MDITLARVPLPCTAARLEEAVLRASHNGHWHDATVAVDSEGNLIVVYPEEDR